MDDMDCPVYDIPFSLTWSIDVTSYFKEWFLAFLKSKVYRNMKAVLHNLTPIYHSSKKPITHESNNIWHNNWRKKKNRTSNIHVFYPLANHMGINLNNTKKTLLSTCEQHECSTWTTQKQNSIIKSTFTHNSHAYQPMRLSQ